MSELTFTEQDLKKMQELPHKEKIQKTIWKIVEFGVKTDWNMYVSFSGGKDSCVLLDLVAWVWARGNKDKQLKVAFANTSNEFCGMEVFVKHYCQYISTLYHIGIFLKIVRGDRTFYDILKDEGYPVASKSVSRKIRDIRKWLKESGNHFCDIEQYLDKGEVTVNYLRGINAPHSIVLYLTGIKSDNGISKKGKLAKRWRPLINAPFEVSEKCCNYLKKMPVSASQRELKSSPILGEMAYESDARKVSYMQTGCIAFEKGKYKAKPMGFWVEQDVLRYIAEHGLPTFSAYGELKKEGGRYFFTGEERTGCKLCLFGIHLGKGPERLIRLHELEPQTYEFAMKPICEGGLGYKEIIVFLNNYCKCNIKTIERVAENDSGNT